MTFRSSISRLALAAGLTRGVARYAAPLAMAAVLSVSASAQLAGKGSINGRIVDSTGAVVPGADVTITDTATNKKQTMKTSGSGEYTFSLDAGHYTIVVSMPGFKTVTQENVNVNALQTFSVDLTLPTGETTEQVTVTDAPPALETSNASLGVTIEQQMYSALPVIQDGGGQRRATDFASLLPGVSAQTTNGNQTTNAGVVNGSGSRGAVSAIYINGIPITSVAGEGDPRFVWTAFPVEAIEQFQIQTNGYSAIYEGQGVQNYTVKRGTNAVHGGIFEFFRNTALDTWPFMSKYSSNALLPPVKPTENQHEYGIYAGFPIIKDKLFFFGTYDGYRFGRTVPQSLETIPTLAMRAGDFRNSGTSNNTVGVYDPNTTQCFAAGGGSAARCSRTQFVSGGNNDVIPQSRFSPAAVYMQKFLPNPINSNTTNNYLASYKTGLNNWNAMGRVDYHITSKQDLSVVLAWGRQSTTAPAAVSTSSGASSNAMLPPYISSQQFAPKTKVFLIEHTYTVTPRIVNQLKYAFGRYDGPGFNQTISPTFAATAAGIKGLPAGQASDSFPTVSFSGNTQINRWAGYSSNRPVANGFALVDNVQMTYGNHNVTVGGEIAWMQYNFLNNATGVNPLQLSFTNALTGGFQANSTSLNTSTGQAYASYLIGAAQSGSFTLSAVPETGARFRPISLYVQDNWKVTSKLTIDAGVRWDYYPSYTEVKDRFSYFDPNATNTLTGTKGALAFGGSAGDRPCNCRTPVNNYFKNLGPRFGFAYQSDSKTVWRGSYGIMYTHGNANGGSATSRQGVGLAGFSVTPSTTTANPATGVTGSTYWQIDTTYPSYTLPPTLVSTLGTFNTTNSTQAAQSPSYADPYYGGRAPQFMNWSFGFQRQITNDMTLTMTYVGSQGHFLEPDSKTGRGIWANQLDPKYLYLGTTLTQNATAANLAAAGLTAPYSSFGGSGNPTITQALKPFPQYNGMSDVYGFVGNTRYHALQTYVQQRLAHGLTFMANYTWSRSIDNNGTFRSGYDIPAAFASDGKFHSARSLDKSLSLGDQRHKFAATAAYDLPFGKGKTFGASNWMVNALAGGWKLSGIFQAFSGSPLAITANSCPNNPAASTCQPLLNPNYVGNGTKVNALPKTAQNITNGYSTLDANAFTATPNFVMSTTARTAPLAGLFQPGNYKLDASLRRSFPIPTGGFHEGTKLTIQADMFNVTNHTRFVYSVSNAPLATWSAGSTSYGNLTVDTNAATNRAVQLAARIEF